MDVKNNDLLRKLSISIVKVMHAKPSHNSSHFGGSGGIVVSSCLDGPRVHQPTDTAWMETHIDSVKRWVHE